MNTTALCFLCIVICLFVVAPTVTGGAFWYRSQYTSLLSATTPLTIVAEDVLKTSIPTFGINPVSYTLSFWIKVPATSSKWRNVFRFGTSDFVRTPAVYVPPNEMKVYYRHGSVADETLTTHTIVNDWGPATIPINANSWNHFVAVIKDRKFTIYLNDKFYSEVMSPASPAVANPLTNKVIFGAATYVDQLAPVSVSDVRFYPRALTSLEIKAISRPQALT